MKKRVLSALLTLCMMLTMAPVAFAAGEGTKDNPFTSVEQYNDAVKTGDWDGKDIYLKIAGTANERKTINAGEFNLTNVQKKFNPPQLHLTIEYCDFNGNTSGDTSENTSFMYLSNCQELVIDNCTFDATDDGLKYGINWNLIQIEGATVSITNSSFTGKYGENAIKLNQRNGEDDVYKTDINPTEGAGSKFAATIKSATISGCTFSGTNAIILLGSAGKGESGNAAPSTGAFPVTITAAENSGANVFLAYLASEQDATDAASKPEEAVQKGLAVQLQANDTALKTTNGDFASPDEFVAKIGDDKYTSLQSAVDAVTLGEETTITLLGNASGDGVKIPSGNNIIFDLGGFTYTIDGETVGSTGTETNGFQLLKNSNITFKNGTITSEKAKILIQNYSNLTLDNVKLDGTKLNDTVPYTLSNNFGNTVIKDSTIIAKEGGYAFDLYYWPKNGYGDGLSVTVEGNSEITGKIEYGRDNSDVDKDAAVAEKAKLNITGGTFTGELSVGNIGTSSKAGINITGGTFQTASGSTWDVSTYLQPGMAQNADGSIVIDTTTAVAKIGDVGYDTLQNAINAADSGDKITLITDTYEKVTVATGDNITLELNGHWLIDNVEGSPAALTNNGTIVIQDSVGTGGIKRLDNPNKTSYYTIKNEGTMTITGGTVYNDSGSTTEWKGSSLICNGASNNATLNISGGTFQQNNFIAVKNDEKGTLNITGGKIISDTQAVQNWCDGNITGGTMIGDVTTWAYRSYDGQTTISGDAYIEGNVTASWFNDGSYKVNEGIEPKVNITGGTVTGILYKATATNLTNTTMVAPTTSGATIDVTSGSFGNSVNENFLNNSIKAELKSASNQEAPFSYFTTIEAALAAAKPGDSVKAVNQAEGTKTYYTLTLKYDDNSTTDSMYEVESGTEVPLPTPTRANYTFGGWSDGTNTYNGGASYTVNATITLTAQWTYSGGSTGGGGGGAATYSVSTPSSVANGTISVSPKSAAKDATVTITVKPNDGYVLDTLTVKDADGKNVSLTKVSDTEYTFKMPASKVTIEAAFKAAETVEPEGPFTDVAASAYYYDAVQWAVDNGITNGVTATTFGPDQAVSRAQMVTFLWRAAGSPKATGANPFTDVKSSDYYYDAVLWAVVNGVTNGTSATTFSPETAVSRAQAVTFQWRAGGSPAATGDSFADVAADAYYADAVTWAVANEITNGMSATSFGPNVTVTRAQAVTFLYRAAN